MPSFNVETLASDSTLFLRSKSLKIADKKVETPRRVLSVTTNPKDESKIIDNAHVRGINEVYRRIDRSKLDKMFHNNGEQRHFVLNLNNAFETAVRQDEISILVFSYDNRTDEQKLNRTHADLPNSKQIEYLFDFLGSSSNQIIVPPLLRYVSGEQYLRFLKDFFDVLESSKPGVVMGTIPADLHRFEYEPLLDFYDKKGVRLFLMDLYGGTPESHYVDINFVLRKLAAFERKSHEVCYLQGLNVRHGKPLSTTPVSPARDVMAFYMGFDAFGTSHIGPRFSEDFLEKLRNFKSPPHPPRLFNRDDYGYYRTDITGTTTFPREHDVTYQIEDFYVGGSTLPEMAKIFNAERVGIEAQQLRTKLAKENTLREYVKSKKKIKAHAPSLLSDVLKLKEDVLYQSTLS